MKSIAEYFRDLAADDRYFGAEPPTPDPVMLHKIAEREIQRRVEAKVQENGVILRADDRPDDRAMPRVTMPAAAPAPLATPYLAPHVAPVAEAGPAVDSAAARLSRLRAAQSQAIAAAVPAAAMVIAPVSPLGDISSRFADIEAYSEDQDAYSTPAPVAVLPEPAPAPMAAPSEVVLALVAEPADQTDAAVLTAIADHIAPADVLDAIVPDPLPTIEIAPDSAKTAQPDLATETLLASLRDAVAPEIAPETAPETAVEIAPEIAVEVVLEPAPEPAPAADPIPVATHDVLAALRETLAGMTVQDEQLAADIAFASDPVPDVLPTADDLPEDNHDDLALLPQADDHIDLSDLMKLDGTPDAASTPTDVSDDAPQSQTPLIDDAAYLDTNNDQPTPDVPSVIVADKADRARARVIKIRRLDKRAAREATLTPEAEADLQNTLAALSAEIAPLAEPAPAAESEADIADKIAAVVAPDQAADITPPIEGAAEAETAPADMIAAETSVEAFLDAELATPDLATTDLATTDLANTDLAPTNLAPANLAISELATSDVPHDARIAAADDAAVDRLMAQTNTQFDVPEVKRRRTAIAHLKAAVLATVADRRINPNAASKGAEVKMDPYRKDLGQAVRPAAPVERPAPLVLVSAQRIDTKRDLVADAGRPVPQIVPSVPAPAATVQPVRPRRVTSGGPAHAVSTHSVEEDEVAPQPRENIFAEGQKPSFSDFAEQLGAESISELIEAAGVYCTLVLDRPSFTRPLLFQQLATMDKMGDLNPEDGLIGFGRLLRNGRIQKSVRGQFALSTTSPLLTEAKRIAG